MKETPPFGDNCQDFGYIDRPLSQVRWFNRRRRGAS